MTPKSLESGLTPYLQLAPLVLLMMGFAALPLAAMVGITFFKSGIFGIEPNITLANYAKFLDDEIYVKILVKSIRIAVTVTILTMLISYPIAFWLAKAVTRYKLLFLVLLFVPYWMNYVIRTYAWLPLLGNSGLVNKLLVNTGIVAEPLPWLLYNEFSVTLVLVYVFLPFGIVPLYLSIERINDDVLRASSDLGATPAGTFLNVVLPLS